LLAVGAPTVCGGAGAHAPRAAKCFGDVLGKVRRGVRVSEQRRLLPLIVGVVSRIIVKGEPLTRPAPTGVIEQSILVLQVEQLCVGPKVQERCVVEVVAQDVAGQHLRRLGFKVEIRLELELGLGLGLELG